MEYYSVPKRNGQSSHEHMEEQDPLTLASCDNTARRQLYDIGSGPSLDTESASIMTLDFPASRTVRNKLTLSVNHLVYGVIFEQPKWTKTLMIPII